MILNCIIVDDEPIARDILAGYIEQVPYLQLVGSCTDAFEAMEVINKMKVDLIILDINMPRLSGFEMLRSLKKYPSVIITSAYTEYALEGFELSVLDYLLKPFSFPRFVQATEKAIKANRESPPPVAPVVAATEDDAETYTLVKADKKLVKVFFNEISYVEAYGNYILVYRDRDKIMSKQTLSQFESQLPVSKFIRVHKSFIVSLNAIKYLEGNQLAIGDTQGGLKKVPIGKVYRDSLLKKFQ